MKLVDTNLMLYAVNTAAPFHQRAIQWLEDSLNDVEPVAFDWNALFGFIRVSTRQGAFPQPLMLNEAFGYMNEWLAQPNVMLLQPTERHAELLQSVLTPLGTLGNLVSDAHLAALAIEHGATLYSTDNDFARFSGLRWRNPLIP
ncbi:MAG: type II toxin-antitoxin system VapC family toxin [Anaerolineae bacterium]|nr:type II toxin-antitoxin system VapC family toxin [Anaerolineae bacterium]